MRSGNNIHVQQHKTNMINEEWNKTQNDAPFVAFYDMRAFTCVYGCIIRKALYENLETFAFIAKLSLPIQNDEGNCQ